MQVVVDGLLTEYERYGERTKPSILLLHGWADSSVSWRSLAHDLAKDFDVTILNLPGFGGTAAPKRAWGLDDYARFVQAFSEKINLKTRLLIGHSNGGAIAVRAVAAGYVQPNKLILLASAGIRNQETGRKNVLRFVAKAGKIITLPLPTGMKQHLRQKLYSSIGSDLLIAEHMTETFRRVVAEDIQADAATVRIPVLLVYGESDSATPPLYGRILHEQFPTVTLELLPGVGHFLQVDAPQRIVRLITEFGIDA